MYVIASIDCAKVCEIRLDSGEKVLTKSKGALVVGDYVDFGDGVLCRKDCPAPIIPPPMVEKKEPETIPTPTPEALEPSVPGLW